jgi:peptidoglycan hydrolase-like protein with peptidoglycan-binding domain
MLRARLTGDALIESQLTPEAHIAIQQALLGKGLLNSRVLKFGAKPDGQFGPNTRAAIQEYQRSVGAKPTGFLSDQQRLALLETPEEVKARAARAAAEAQARQATLDAWKQTEERAKRDEERARQAALDAKKQAEEQAKRDEEQRLEEEAAKAAEWRQKIEEAQKKGPDYATKVSDMKWTLNQHANPMTEEIDYSASSMQTNGSGAAASVDGFCRNDQVLFQATLENATDPKLPLGFITSPYGGGIVGKKRLNDGAVMPTEFPAEKWRNRITLSTLAFSHDAAEGAETTWRILAEIETSHGTLYVKIPMFNVSIQKLVSNCQQLYEREKQRGGRPDAPASRP